MSRLIDRDLATVCSVNPTSWVATSTAGVYTSDCSAYTAGTAYRGIDELDKYYEYVKLLCEYIGVTGEYDLETYISEQTCAIASWSGELVARIDGKLVAWSYSDYEFKERFVDITVLGGASVGRMRASTDVYVKAGKEHEVNVSCDLSAAFDEMFG